MRNLIDEKKSGNILEETIISLLKRYRREVINFPYLKTEDDKEKSVEKINEMNGLILQLIKEI